ncbi:MAG: hypothetical protein ACKPKO_21235, partial [Candidatus Fonsibacter sp.]
YVQTETGGALGSGGMQGDCVMPEQCTVGYNAGIQRWTEDTEAAGWRSLKAEEPLTREEVDLSISVYADDLWRTRIVEDMEEVRTTVREWDGELDRRLGSMGMGQNHDKKGAHGKNCGPDGDVKDARGAQGGAAVSGQSDVGSQVPGGVAA